jgi:hypothetical protein
VTPPIEPSLFDFVEEFAAEVENGKVARLDTVEESAAIIVFCQTFFLQFFAALGHDIDAFDQAAKHEASEIVERLRLKEGTGHWRALIALFESLCDMYADVLGGTYGSGSITYQKFHVDYMRRLLSGAEDWAEIEGLDELAGRISAVSDVYGKAMKAKRW